MTRVVSWCVKDESAYAGELIGSILNDPRGWARAGLEFPWSGCDEAEVLIAVLLRAEMARLHPEHRKADAWYWPLGSLYGDPIPSIWICEENIESRYRFQRVRNLNHEMGHHLCYLDHRGSGIMSANPVDHWRCRGWPTDEDIALVREA